MIRMLVANGHPIVREGLKQLVTRWRNIELVGMAGDGNGTLSLAKVIPADVLLLDTSMKGRGFLDVLRRVGAAQPGLRVLVLSGNAEVAFAVRVLKAGASGYLSNLRLRQRRCRSDLRSPRPARIGVRFFNEWGEDPL